MVRAIPDIDSPAYSRGKPVHGTHTVNHAGSHYRSRRVRRLDDEAGTYHVVLTDIVDVPIPKGVRFPQNAKVIKADLLGEASNIVEERLDAAFILHGIMSSGSEENFEMGMRVNFDATRALLDTLRHKCPGIRVIYTSASAMYGGSFPQPVSEKVRLTPESSYGCEKMMCKCLINEYTRRGYLDGLILRLPSISVQPGKPSAAASSFISGIICEPLQGLPCMVPIRDRSFAHWLSSLQVLVKNLIHCLGLPGDALPGYDRVVCLPGIGVTVQDMMDLLERVGGNNKLAYVSEVEDLDVARILYSWPATFDNAKAMALGFYRDASFDDIVADFKGQLEQKAL